MRRVLLCLITALIAVAAATQAAPPTAQRPTVTLPLFITDGRGRPASGMAASDLSITDEQKAPQSVIGIYRGTSPLRLGVVIDISSSQRSELFKAALPAISAMIRQAFHGPDDKVFIETFTTAPNVLTPWMNAEQAANFHIDLLPRGGSSIFDAVDIACRKRMSYEANPSRRILILLSDGDDNRSRVDLDTAVASAQRSGTVIFAVDTEENAYMGTRGASKLERIAESTGGSVFLPARTKVLPNIFSEIRQQIEGMYQVTYVPSESAKSVAFHHVEIRLTSGKKLHVRAPKGYYSPEMD